MSEESTRAEADDYFSPLRILKWVLLAPLIVFGFLLSRAVVAALLFGW